MNTLIIFVVGVSFGFLISSSLSSTHNEKKQMKMKRGDMQRQIIYMINLKVNIEYVLQ